MLRTLGLGVVVACALPQSVLAQDQAHIFVSASATVKTPPDRAVITYDLRGEGATSDEALEKLNAVADTTERATSGFLGKPVTLETGTLSIRPVRGDKCEMTNYGPAHLSQGDCAILGYAAEVDVTLRTDRVEDAGTLAGLIGRAGGLEPQIARFELADESGPHTQAMRRALASAREQASQIAMGSGVKLGPVQRIQDGAFQDIEKDLAMHDGPPAALNMAPPPVVAPPPPVGVKLTPAPIETNVQIMVSYAIAS